MTKTDMILLLIVMMLMCLFCASCAQAHTCFNQAITENDGCDIYIITD